MCAATESAAAAAAPAASAAAAASAAVAQLLVRHYVRFRTFLLTLKKTVLEEKLETIFCHVRNGVFAGYLRWSPGGIWGVFGGIWGYLRRGRSDFDNPMKMDNLRFPLACAADSAIRQPRLPRQERHEKRDELTSSIILIHEKRMSRACPLLEFYPRALSRFYPGALDGGSCGGKLPGEADKAAAGRSRGKLPREAPAGCSRGTLAREAPAGSSRETLPREVIAGSSRGTLPREARPGSCTRRRSKRRRRKRRRRKRRRRRRWRRRSKRPNGIWNQVKPGNP